MIGLYLAVHTANHLLLKYMADLGLSSGQILFIRGAGCFALALAWGIAHQQSFVPKSWSTQVLRIAVAGAAFALIVSAYPYTDAASVALIQRMDVAILVLIGASMRSQKLLAAIALGSLPLFVSFLPLVLALSGTFLIAIGFLLLKKAAAQEAFVMIPLVAGLSNSIFGGSMLLIQEPGAWVGTPQLIVLGALSGTIMFAVYWSTVQLYQRWSVILTEYLALYTVVSTAVLEGLFLQKWNENWVGLVGVLAVISSILALPKMLPYIRSNQ